MKRVVIGDIHGNSGWKNIVDRHQDADEFIFVGDYLDPYRDSTLTNFMQRINTLANFKDIVKFRDENPDKVVLLFGNHDIHYFSAEIPCSRYDEFYVDYASSKFRELFNQKKIKVAHGFEGVIVSHAGISPYWFHKNTGETMDSLSNTQIVDKVNQLAYDKLSAFYFDMNDKSWCGEYEFQSPMWIRPETLRFCISSLKGNKKINQVVGHTKVPYICDNGFKHSLWMVDVQSSKNFEGLVFIDGEPQISNIRQFCEQEASEGWQ